MTAPAEQGQRLLYLYGFVLPGTVVPEDLTGIDGGAVRLVDLGRVSALVSEVPDAELIGLPAEIRAHASVLDAAAQAGPVLPVQFGTAMPDADSLAPAVAGEQDEYVDELHRLADVVQLAVRARYVGETVMAELVEEDPEIRQLREATRGRDEDSTYYERVRLGELVVAGFDRKRAEDAAALQDELAPYVADLAVRERAEVEDVLDVAVLVRRAEVEHFEDALEGLAARTVGRITFRLVGPQAPYDFTES
ncbi:GvpL/GvpF family gas vesicle protein [Georgenia alba]|uniref:GvpL/GvpF family gas vesicle protein n=1 Tax=Georgenia alba TaxID=2233858 RepID=A0ABW2Q8L4_9MICO